jgi:cell division protein ZapA
MRLTVMAALILADELSEARQRMHRVEEELGGLQQARAAAVDRSEAAEADLAAAFNSAAERIEKAARLLGQSGDGHHLAIG